MNQTNLLIQTCCRQHRPHQTTTAKSLSLETTKKIHYVATDPGYEGKSLYDLRMKTGFQLECRGLVKRYSRKYFRRKTRTTNRFLFIGFEPINLFEDQQIYKTAYRTHQVYIRIIPVSV
jgi:hypothetical protein